MSFNIHYFINGNLLSIKYCMFKNKQGKETNCSTCLIGNGELVLCVVGLNFAVALDFLKVVDPALSVILGLTPISIVSKHERPDRAERLK